MIEDQILKCSVCATPFLWTSGEQAAGARPERCPMCQKLTPAPGRERGIVKWYSRAKGYGFITRAAGAEVFFHKSGLERVEDAPTAGQLVEFALGRGPRGEQAEQVTLLTPPSH